ncbi:MAG: nicotinate-nucleotide adenylyltransferase [Dehalococcoidia bacterium]|nr:nicotinate-nucleotide adenylyltransferase [Dehalococcoidia bacterium]
MTPRGAAQERLGVLGGTFDPVHLGHLILAETAREQAALGRVLFVPAGRPWRKAGRQIAPAEHRLQMLRLATADNPAFAVSTIELYRQGPSYTAETLAALKAEHPEAALFFILGEDALADLPNWREPERIRELATLLVARRARTERSPESGGGAPPGTDERLTWLEMPLIEISATDIRQRARRGGSARYLVPDAVEAYIRETGLYVK